MNIKAFITPVYGTFLRLAKGLAWAPLMLFFLLSPAAAGPASEVIEAFHENLLQTMKNAKVWTYPERRDFLQGPVAETFYPELMVRLASTSRIWETFSPEQQEELTEAFEAFMVANYASRFKGFSGQDFITLGEEPMRGQRLLVKTKLINGRDEIQLDYVMYLNPEGEYRAIDVFQKGAVSEMAIRKSEFSPILRDQGFTGLLSLLKLKVRNLEREALPPS